MITHPPTITQLISAAREMRRLQRDYFRTRDKGVLADSKAAERRFDALLEAIDSPQERLEVTA